MCGCLLHTHHLGTWPTTQACALTGNRTSDPLAHRLALNLLSHQPGQKLEFIYKKLCIYSYTFKFQSPSKYSPFDAIHLSRCLFHCSKQFLNLSILMPFSASAVFCFTSSILAKCFPLRTFSLIQENKKKLIKIR